MKVAVLGCGPAGLIAANAAVMAGANVKILSKPRKSFMNGAQYLHSPIPGTDPGEAFVVNYQMIGTPEGYRRKVYGPMWDGTVSPEDLEETHMAWDIRTTYDQLWSLFSGYVEEWYATPAGVRNLFERSKPDLVVSTIPAPLLCAEGHSFRATSIYSTDKAIGIIEGDNVVVCNGESSPAWYRCSRIQGHENTEWTSDVRPPISPMWEVTKPLKTNCDCFPQVMRGGRYGKWTKAVLSHEIGMEVTERCAEFMMGQS